MENKGIFVTQLLKGQDIAGKVQEGIRKDLSRIQEEFGERPKLVALQVGEQQASQLYVKKQHDTAENLGITHELLQLKTDITQEETIEKIDELNHDDSVHAIIIQMPLPEHMNLEKVLSSIHYKKDAEGVHTDNLGRLVLKKAKVAPCTAIAALELINSTGVDLYGKEAVVVGSSKVIGRPVSLLLLEQMATVTVCHLGTFKKGDLESHVRRAEVLVVAVGKANLIPGEWIREGAIVIDIGINRVDGKTVGDVDFESAKEKASFITPVPGGVGPLTVTMLMRNVVNAYLWQKGKETEDR